MPQGLGPARERLQRDGDQGRLQALEQVEKSVDDFRRTGLTVVEACLEGGHDAGNRLKKGSEGAPGSDRARERIRQSLTALREPRAGAVPARAAEEACAAQALVPAMR